MTRDTDAAVHHDEELGIRTVGYAPLGAGEARVEVPNMVASDPTIRVTGEALDDDDGNVILKIGDGVSVSVALSAGEARALATTLDRAADDAEAEI